MYERILFISRVDCAYILHVLTCIQDVKSKVQDVELKGILVIL